MSKEQAQQDIADNSASTKFETCDRPMCGMRFHSTLGLLQHQMDHVLPGARYECFHCGKWFMVLGDLMVHLMTHGGVKLYSCSACGEGFSSFIAARTHVQTHVQSTADKAKVQSRTNTGEVLYTCSLCGEELDMMSSFCSHMGNHDKEYKEKIKEPSQTLPASQTEKDGDSRSKVNTEAENRGKMMEADEKMRTAEITHTPNNQEQTNEAGKECPAKELRMCMECGKIYDPSSVLHTHIKTHQEETKYPCSLCGTAFETLSERNSHLRIHLYDTVFRCSKCGMLLRDKSSLDMHVLTHNETLAVCAELNETVTAQDNTSTERNETMKEEETVANEAETEMETDEGPHICVLCGAEFETWAAVNAHLKGHNIDKPHSCPQCDKSFQHELHLKMHVMSHPKESMQGKRKGSPRKGKSMACPAILRRRATVNTKENVPSNLDGRARIHRELGDDNLGESEQQSYTHIEGGQDMAVPTGKHRCSLCGRQFQNSWNLYQHVRKHKGGAHRCSVCNVEFEHLWHLHQHMIAHREKTVKCAVCSEEFREKVDLYVHMQVHKSRKCPICWKTFHYPASVVEHMGVHTRKPYNCSRCDRVFTYEGNLQKHMVVHEDAPAAAPISPSHKCYICSEEFMYLADLAEHNKLDHPVASSMATHVCGLCGKGFSEPSQFVDHKLEHVIVTGKSTYKCPYCAREFLLLSSMKQHMTKHIKLNCPYCGARYRVAANFKKHVASHTCLCCGVLFPKLADLKEHLSELKEQEENGLCSVCSRGCGKCICIQGSRTDWAAYDYAACDTCVKGFLLLSDLQNHLETHIKS